MTDFTRFFIPLYFILFFAISFIGISYRVAKQIGKNPNVLPRDDSAYGLVGFYFKLILFTLFIYVMLFSIFPHILSVFKISFLNQAVFQCVGFILMIEALIWVITAQIQMKNSWRIGIDNTTKTELITQGLFRFSRNPIFLGMTISLIGFFLVIPTVIALTFFLMGSILMQIQIRLEEEYLMKEHGQIYLAYKNRVKRMLSLY